NVCSARSHQRTGGLPCKFNSCESLPPRVLIQCCEICTDDSHPAGQQGRQTALRDRHEGPLTVRDRRHLGKLEEPGGGWVRTFAVLTTPANELVGTIHDRMPAVLARVDYDR